MAINVYTPGCHLLCHDDVIGSRRISYILYLTDPDIPWKAEWGGALRLYPTTSHKENNGETTKTPSPDFTKVIPPAWNQLSFFAVQPGESFHDVEEVFHAPSKEQLETDGGRVRMAISGWFHIPQVGEEGYVKGAEEKLAAKSSLMQLQGNPDSYDFPQQQLVTIETPIEPAEDRGLEASDIDFLLKYMAPTYLTPDTLEQVSEHFAEESSVTLDSLLSKKYSEKIQTYITAQEEKGLPQNGSEIEKTTSWKVARPPHKHRFLYQQPTTTSPDPSRELDPIQEILEVLFPSHQFQKWLSIATECEIENYDVLARRFRRGCDYALATSHDGNPKLEISLGLTPTPGWGADEEEEDGEEKQEEGEAKDAKTVDKANVKDKRKSDPEPDPEEEEDDVGGHEVYMAADDDAADAAIYKASTGEEDDNVLFTMPASWNKMSIVLRDSGVLKFVKYVSRNAKGDRWDVGGAFGVKDLGDDEEDEEEEEEHNATKGVLEASSEDEVFNGFPDSSDSDSD